MNLNNCSTLNDITDSNLRNFSPHLVFIYFYYFPHPHLINFSNPSLLAAAFATAMYTASEETRWKSIWPCSCPPFSTRPPQSKWTASSHPPGTWRSSAHMLRRKWAMVKQYTWNWPCSTGQWAQGDIWTGGLGLGGGQKAGRLVVSHVFAHTVWAVLCQMVQSFMGVA